MKMKKLYWPAGILTMVFVFILSAHAQGIIITPRPPSPPSPASLILERSHAEDPLLEAMKLKVGSKSIDYFEDRISRSNSRISSTKKKFSEPEKEIALKLLHLDSGQTEIIKIIKRGAELISPLGYQISIISRVNGIRWNKWNTAYRVDFPAQTVVIKNKFPEVNYVWEKEKVRNKTGKWITVNKKKPITEEITYSPYSPDIHLSELAEEGKKYLKNKVEEAKQALRKRGVHSQAFPDQLVGDLIVLPPSFFEHIPFLEQSDLTEFALNSQETVERVAILLALNGSRAFAKTCSKASACGWTQFTPGTYRLIARTYSSAQLISDFAEGSADHLNSMMASILLYDYNLNGLISRHGRKILNDPRLEEYLAASYNGSPLRTAKSLHAALLYDLEEWTGRLKPETKGFIAKLRFLQDQNWP